jgi:hypothetical protein
VSHEERPVCQVYTQMFFISIGRGSFAKYTLDYIGCFKGHFYVCMFKELCDLSDIIPRICKCYPFLLLCSWVVIIVLCLILFCELLFRCSSNIKQMLMINNVFYDIAIAYTCTHSETNTHANARDLYLSTSYTVPHTPLHYTQQYSVGMANV